MKEQNFLDGFIYGSASGALIGGTLGIVLSLFISEFQKPNFILLMMAFVLVGYFIIYRTS